MDERRVLPLWLDPKAATRAGERAGITSARRLSGREEHWLVRLKTEFEDQRNEATALEFATTAELLGVPEAAEAARRHLKSSRAVRVLDRQEQKVAETEKTGFQTSPRQAARIAIPQLKRKLENPHQPLAWSELARNYLVLGQKEKARRAMEAALLVASPSRYLLRVATRLFIHLDDPERALHLLHSHPGLKEDPWLLAAEISTNSVLHQRSSFMLRSANQLQLADIAPIHLTELRAAIATAEYEYGHRRRAKEMFGLSESGANANVIAQLEWVRSIDPDLGLKSKVQNLNISGEAEAWRARSGKEWRQVLSGCERWQIMEPYSSRSMLLASYTAHAALRDYKASAQYCSLGLETDPAHFTLLNNRAVARAREGQIGEAIADIVKAAEVVEEEDIPVLLATVGLVEFRAGNPATGEELYRQSVEDFVEQKRNSHAVFAILHLADELMSFSPERGKEMLDLAKKCRRFVSGPPDLEIEAYLDGVEATSKRPPEPQLLSGLVDVERLEAIAIQASTKLRARKGQALRWTTLLHRLRGHTRR